eukprot:TRINITY_DN6238_c0_g1_i1.p1 TRINITY_DN6238_c0_g1~~TRINITY_DN6238_c0_g1_i1.p1  ORF type:complete len:395 (+),score=51.60 TRINITY_DN6238_c0_g1_i1:167-1186(+)
MISCGGIHTAVLMEDGGVECWGRCHERIRPPARKIVSISAGGSHTLVLTNDGKVSAFGNAAFGSASPPHLSVRVKQISAGGSHSTVLLENGRIVCWGRIPQHEIPTEKAAYIAAGESHSLAILAEPQKVVGWGDNSSGQAQPPLLELPAVSVSAGGRHSLALLCDGTVVGWGHPGNRRICPPEFSSKIVQISAGGMHSLAVDEKGKVYVWGYNGNGQQNIPFSEEQVCPLPELRKLEQTSNKSSRKLLKPRKPRIVRQQDAFIRTFTQLPIFQSESVLSLPPPKSRPRPAAAISFAQPFDMEFDEPLPLNIFSQRLPSIKVNKNLKKRKVPTSFFGAPV